VRILFKNVCSFKIFHIQNVNVAMIIRIGLLKTNIQICICYSKRVPATSSTANNRNVDCPGGKFDSLISSIVTYLIHCLFF